VSLLGKRRKTEDLLLAEELAVVQATDIVCRAMDVSQTSRKALADAVGVSASEITQRLRGTRNLTLRSLVDMLDALDHELVIDARPRSQTLPASGSSARYVAESNVLGAQRQ
jgi:transcriptional regulator with XRE-family HTH domain